jgi:hypothetical protein
MIENKAGVIINIASVPAKGAGREILFIMHRQKEL